MQEQQQAKQQQAAHLRLVVDNTGSMPGTMCTVLHLSDPPTADEIEELNLREFAKALRRWHHFRPHYPQHFSRLEAFAALATYWPEAAAGFSRKTWGFN